MINSPIYMHDSFVHLFDLLHRLKVFDVRYHKISHQMTMIRSFGTPPYSPPGHWIPLPVLDTSMNFVEVVSTKSGSDAT